MKDKPKTPRPDPMPTPNEIDPGPSSIDMVIIFAVIVLLTFVACVATGVVDLSNLAGPDGVIGGW